MTEEITAENLVDYIETGSDDDDGTHVSVTPRTNKLQITTRWNPWCRQCDQYIGGGAVGPVFHEDPKHPSGNGSVPHQHGCGAHNDPTAEVISLNKLVEAAKETAAENPQDTSIEVEPARQSDYDVVDVPKEYIYLEDIVDTVVIDDEDRNLPIDPLSLANQAVEAAKRRLASMCQREKNNWEEYERKELAKDVLEVKKEYEELLREGDTEEADDLQTADDQLRGFAIEKGKWVGWSCPPHDFDNPIQVDEDSAQRIMEGE